MAKNELTDTDRIEWIDQAPYEDLLRKWRREPRGSAWCTGKVGEHYARTMRLARERIGPEAHAAASKAVGW